MLRAWLKLMPAMFASRFSDSDHRVQDTVQVARVSSIMQGMGEGLTRIAKTYGGMRVSAQLLITSSYGSLSQLKKADKQDP